MVKKKKKTIWQVIKLSLLGLCPNCGKGKLLKSYLKQVDKCSACNEEYGHIRADDGPAWLTILLTGHIVVPIAMSFAAVTEWPDWYHITIWSIMSMVLILLILPFAKRLFIAIIWHTGCTGSEK